MFARIVFSREFLIQADTAQDVLKCRIVAQAFELAPHVDKWEQK